MIEALLYRGKRPAAPPLSTIQKGQLLTGEIVWHKVANANPIQGLLSFTLASNKGSQTAYAA